MHISSQVQPQRVAECPAGSERCESLRDPSRRRADPGEQQPAEPAGQGLHEPASPASDAAQQPPRARVLGLARGSPRLPTGALSRRAGTPVVADRQPRQSPGSRGDNAPEQVDEAATALLRPVEAPLPAGQSCKAVT